MTVLILLSFNNNAPHKLTTQRQLIQLHYSFSKDGFKIEILSNLAVSYCRS